MEWVGVVEIVGQTALYVHTWNAATNDYWLERIFIKIYSERH